MNPQIKNRQWIGPRPLDLSARLEVVRNGIPAAQSIVHTSYAIEIQAADRIGIGKEFVGPLTRNLALCVVQIEARRLWKAANLQFFLVLDNQIQKLARVFFEICCAARYVDDGLA